MSTRSHRPLGLLFPCLSLPSLTSPWALLTTQVVSLGHFWDGTPADETLRDYIRFEYGRSSFVVDTVVQAVGFLEQTWNQNSGMPAPQRANLSDRALTLLLSVNGTLTPQAANAWRWRLLFLRALIDQTLGANGGKMSGPVLCKAFAEVAAIQHIEDAYAGCAPIRVPCS